MANAPSATITAFSGALGALDFRKGTNSRRSEQVRHASSLLRIAACRAALLLRLADDVDGREPDKATRLGLLLKDLQEDLKSRLVQAEATIRPYEVELRLSFRQELGWKRMKKDFYAQLYTCEKLSEGLAQCLEQRDSETLTCILARLEKSAAVAQSHTELLNRNNEELDVKIEPDGNLNFVNSDNGLEKDVSQEPPPGRALAMMVQPMYKLCIEGLHYISRIVDSNFSSLYERLKGWGLGLFQGTYDLTKMLTQNHVQGGQCSAFHTILISILVQIDEMIPAVTGPDLALLDFSDTLRTFFEQDLADARLQRAIQTSRLTLQKEIGFEPNPDTHWHAEYLEEQIQDLFLLLPVVEAMRDGYTPPEPTRVDDAAYSIQEVNVGEAGKADKPFMADVWKYDKATMPDIQSFTANVWK